MRVLHLMSCRGWSSDAYWAARMAVELGRVGHAATLVCRRGADARVIEPARRLGVAAVETLAFPSGWHPAVDARDVRRIARWLEGHDIVHVHRGKEHWLAAAANRLGPRRRPLVRTRHIVHPVRAHPLNRWLYRAATDLVVTPTEAIRRQLLAAGLAPAAAVHAVPGGVDAAAFPAGADGGAFRRAAGIPPERAVVGLVGGFRPMKGHAVAVTAVARLAARGWPVHLLMAGRGPAEPAVRAAVRAAGLEDRATLLGPLDDLPGALAALDVAVYAAVQSDGMSRMVLEYLAAGRPLVASRVGLVPEVLEDGRTALLVPAGDAAALAAAIERLLDAPGLAAALGAAGRALVAERLSGARVAARLVELYAGLLAGDRG